jgi:ABC-type antimicrobial peptide transport system permease subunit
MNMATARAASRAKEVCIRKVVGAQRYSLIFQFIMESVAISFISLIIALGITYTILPIFNSLVSKNIQINLGDSNLLIASLIIVIATGLVAGSYPAFFLSSYKPATVLKGNASSLLGGTLLRRGLVVFQFTLTIILGISALVIFEQVQYIRNKDLGYDREYVLTFPLQGDLRNKFDAFRNKALQIPGVQYLSRADNSLVQINNQNNSLQWPGRPDDSNIFFRTVCVDFDFIETMGLKLDEGRNFSRDFKDSTSFIINKRALEVMGLANPIGQRVTQWGREGEIVGIVEDFHGRSMHEPIDPIVLMLNIDWTWRVFLRFEGDKTSEVIPQLTDLYKEFNPEHPLRYSFLDDDFERLYTSEKVTSSLATSFTIMTIIISGLGLLGLAAYTTERRQKEISIRKTLGASVTTLITMMCKDFLMLSVVAAVIGSPIAYYLMTRFL